MKAISQVVIGGLFVVAMFSNIRSDRLALFQDMNSFLSQALGNRGPYQTGTSQRAQWEQEENDLEQAYLVKLHNIKKEIMETNLKANNTKHQKKVLNDPNLNQHLLHVNTSNSMAACLMVMDDNHYLIEWLAFHYHVLPLRRLIVLPDPNSKTSPAKILHRWNGRINYTIFTIKDVYPNGKPLAGKNDYATTLIRQFQFYNQCMRRLKAEGSSWTMLTDVDEYTHIHLRAYNHRDPIYNLGFDDKQWKLPPLNQSGSVLAVLDHAFKINHTPYGLNELCVAITRKHFGAAEHESSKNETKAIRLLGFNVSHFATHRWRHLHPKNQLGKVIIDLSRLPANEIDVKNPHDPIKKCSNARAWTLAGENPFMGYHYSGTLEQSLVRAGDHWTTNRTERFYNNLRDYRGEIAPLSFRDWLDGFVESVGIEAARHLLQHVGKVKETARRRRI